MGYFEMLDDDRPPERIWMDDEALSQHWEKVDERRKRPHDGGTEPVPQAGGLDQNELTAQFKR